MNKIAKKIFALTATLALSANIVAFAACGGGSGDDASSSVENSSVENSSEESSSGEIGGNEGGVVAYDGSDVTVTFYHTMGQKLREVLDNNLPNFNAMYPNITIEHSTQGDWNGVRDIITTELNGGNSPNLAYCYPDHVALYNKSKRVATLDEYIQSTAVVTRDDGTTDTMGFGLTEEQLQNELFVKSYYDEGRAYGDGLMYTLPYSKSTEVLYYNKTFFEANGLKVPTTWDEMETVCRQILTLDSKCVPLGYDSEGNWFITMCEQLGTPYTSATQGEKFLFDVDKNHEFVAKFTKWFQDGLLITEETYGSYTSDLFTADASDYNSYMTIGSSAGASYQCPDKDDGTGQYPFEVGVAMIPQIDAANPKVISQGPSICMFKKKNAQEMAATWLFLKWLITDPYLQAEFSQESGYTTVLRNLGEKLPAYQTNFLDKADGNARLAASCIKQCIAQADANAMFVSPAFLGSSGARDQVGLLMQSCFVNAPEGDGILNYVKGEFTTVINKLRYDYGA